MVPPVWVQIVLGALTLAREVVKYLKDKEENDKRAVADKITALKHGFKTARLEKNTDELEKSFADLKLPHKPSDSK